MPARAELIAFTADGTEVLLYRYLAEQRAWARLAGPQWRRLLDDGDWLRVRMMRPNPEALPRLGATCIERGVYEAWVTAAELDGRGDVVVRYADLAT